jgi:hypothetical protein
MATPRGTNRRDMMRLSTFIETRQSEIFREWDDFAEKLVIPKEKNKGFHVRDLAGEILRELVADMNTKQSKKQQSAKSQDMASAKAFPQSAANIHGLLRHNDGLNVSQVVAEFRALRATVLRLWLPTLKDMSGEVVDDIIRFNESIDEVVADSSVSYDQQ